MANLKKRDKLQCFNKLSVGCNSKPFWKACKPHLSNKNSNILENIVLLEKDEFVIKTKGCPFNFQKTFRINETSMSLGNDTMNSIIQKFTFCRSKTAIKKKFKT